VLDGWQMVRLFMQNNDMPLENLLKTNAKEIFIKSKYKPKKVMSNKKYIRN
jgi:hypothetical protein